MPTGTISDPLHHSFSPPPFEDAKVLDAMRLGVIGCAPDTPVREVARIMATYRIHCVIVSEPGAIEPVGVVADVDLAAAAAAAAPDADARAIATTEPLTVTPEESLGRAAQLMAEHGLSHLLVVQPHSRHAVGILSALDLAGVLAWGGPAHR
jgi:CBS domain-containing protein